MSYTIESKQIQSIDHAKKIISNARKSFIGIIEDEKVYKKEANFAIQIISGNDFAMTQAINNPASLRDAIVNLASTGLTLNPVEKKAYLVPRKGAIHLDISYMGLIDIAITDGAILWAKSIIVKSSDIFELNGLDKQPTHQYNPFDNNRGHIVGVYCVAKYPNGDYITDCMSISEINNIRSRSSATSGPWKTDFEEMAKKTIIKRASKYWKGSSKLKTAIDILDNQNNEGIDFKKEIKAEVVNNDVDYLINGTNTIEAIEETEE